MAATAAVYVNSKNSGQQQFQVLQKCGYGNVLFSA
jgi:hypothetical protein